LNDSFQNMGDGKESNYFEPLEKKTKKILWKTLCFKIYGFVDSHGPNQLLGKMA
jgi:hypothetical protein